MTFNALENSQRPQWLTFDCYGTLIQWDEGLQAAVRKILSAKQTATIDPARFISIYDQHEHALEQSSPHRSFRSVTADALRLALDGFGLQSDADDARTLTDSISAMPPFPEVTAALKRLKDMGYRLCIVSNTDDEIIAGNVAQLGGLIDRVVTAQQAGAYKPSRKIFDYAFDSLGVTKDDVVHICASPRLDHAAAREVGFRCVWIDRGTGRMLLPDYTPDATLPTLDQVPVLFNRLGW
jgi:2-haloacid dehalogenase